MPLDRYNAYINNPLRLISYIKDSNGYLFDPYSVDVVEIFDYNPVTSGSFDPPIQIIIPPNIIRTSTGVYYYDVNALSVSGTYYDVITVTPVSGAIAEMLVNQFTVKQVNITSTGYLTSNVRVFSNGVLDGQGLPIGGASVIFSIYETPTESSTGYLLSSQPIELATLQDGSFSTYLVRGVVYQAHIPLLGLKKIFRVPDDVTEIAFELLLTDLTPITNNPGTGSLPNSGGSETNNFLGKWYN